VSPKLKHFAILFGLGTYILLSAWGIAGRVYNEIGIPDIQVSIPISIMLSMIVGIVVFYALYHSYAKEIRKSRKYLAKYYGSVELLLVLGPAAAAVVVIFVAVLKAPLDPARSTERPVASLPETTAPTTDHEKALVRPSPSVSASEPTPNSTGNIEGPIVATSDPPDVCELSEAFSPDQLVACIRDIRKNPGRPGIGGPGNDLNKGNEKGKRPARHAPRPRDLAPLDIRPPLR
jgi:hypothetical protein